MHRIKCTGDITISLTESFRFNGSFGVRSSGRVRETESILCTEDGPDAKLVCVFYQVMGEKSINQHLPPPPTHTHTLTSSATGVDEGLRQCRRQRECEGGKGKKEA